MKIVELHLQCPNLLEQVQFYSQVLSVPMLEQTNSHVVFQIGSSKLHFHLEPNSTAKYHFAFNIPEQQFLEATTWLENRAELVKDELGETHFHTANWNANQVYFYDPAGNILELIARHELKHDAITPFDSSSILNICEIGLAVPNAADFADWAEVNLKISKYRQGSSSFTPIGDAHGLIIAASIGREWYPNTNIQAQPHFVKIILEGKAPLEVTYLNFPYYFKVL